MGFIAGLGMTNVDLLYKGMNRMPDKGEELYSEGFSLMLGGGLPATLINLGKLGIEAKICTCLGNDIFSGFAKNEYEKSGVKPIVLNSSADIPLTITSAVILPDDRSFISYKNDIEVNYENEELFYNTAKGCDICLMNPNGFTDVYRKLKDDGAILVLDTGWDDELSFEKYGQYLELADYYTPNRKEAMKITGENTPEKAALSLKKYFDKVIVKVDSEGCIGIDGDREFFVKSVDNFSCVDSTGAGDAFLAGFVYGIYHGYSFEECIEFGNITGGNAVTKVGVIGAKINENELIKIKNSYYL